MATESQDKTSTQEHKNDHHPWQDFLDTLAGAFSWLMRVSIQLSFHENRIVAVPLLIVVLILLLGLRYFYLFLLLFVLSAFFGIRYAIIGTKRDDKINAWMDSLEAKMEDIVRKAMDNIRAFKARYDARKEKDVSQGDLEKMKDVTSTGEAEQSAEKTEEEK